MDEQSRFYTLRGPCATAPCARPPTNTALCVSIERWVKNENAVLYNVYVDENKFYNSEDFELF